MCNRDERLHACAEQLPNLLHAVVDIEALDLLQTQFTLESTKMFVCMMHACAGAGNNEIRNLPRGPHLPEILAMMRGEQKVAGTTYADGHSVFGVVRSVLCLDFIGEQVGRLTTL